MKIVWKTILTVMILVALNALYGRYAYEDFVAEHADQYLQAKKVKDADILYLSASSNFASGLARERDPRKISQMLADHFPGLRVEAINQPASHAGIHRALLSMFTEDAEANVFVVTMNLRSYGPDWIHSELETPLRQAAVCYNDRPPLLNRALIALKAYDDTPLEERHALRMKAWSEDPLPFEPPKHTVTDWCAVEKWGDWRNPKRQLADQFIKQYGFVLDETNPRVKDFDAIADMAAEEGWTLVFNLLAENTQKADSLVGSELVGLMRSNADWLVERYEAKGFAVVNNLEAVDSKHFTDKDFPTEHYDDVGRRIIADRVAERLKAELGNVQPPNDSK